MLRFGDLQVGDTIIPATPAVGYTGIVVDKNRDGVLVYWFNKLSGEVHPHSPHMYNNTTTTFNYKRGPNKSEEAEWE